MRNRRWLLAGFATFGLVLAACGSSGGGGSASGSAPASKAGSAAGQPVMLRSDKTSVGTVLTNAQGHTLYWFAIDTPASSKCTGACASTWPPVTGTARLSPAVHATGKLGTIKRSDGSVQVTYNGHPLYTYAGDHSAGQANGNGINGFGGLWHAVVLSGSGAGASPSSSSSSGGGGYGY